jgi:hypothetical protein
MTFKIIVVGILAAMLAVGIAAAKTGFDFGLGMGAGSVTVEGPVTPSGNFLLIDGAGNYLLIDNSSNKLRIDGAG